LLKEKEIQSASGGKGCPTQILSSDSIGTIFADVTPEFIIPPQLSNALREMGKDKEREFVLGLLRLSEIKSILWLNTIFPNTFF